MSDAAWSVTSSKRKLNGKSTNPRKRMRKSYDCSGPSTTGPRNEQQTLTQIAFVNASSLEEDDASSDLDLSSANSPQPRRSAPPRLPKRDSTLTQMDFIGQLDTSEDREAVKRENLMLPPSRRQHKKVKKRDSTLTQMDFFNASMDGAAELDETMLPDPDDATTLPQTPSSRSALSGLGRGPASGSTPGLTARRKSRSERGRRGHIEEPESPNRRRRSNRIAATASPTVDMASVRAGSTFTGSTNSRRNPLSAARRPLLEIQDSTEFLEEPIESLLQVNSRPTPSTPIRSSRKIPSSQTPESIKRSPASNAAISPSKVPLRQPLAALSNNVRRSSRKGHTSKLQTPASPNVPTLRRRGEQKICVLKIPRNALATLSRGHRVDDSDHDVYSLQPTSSPVRHNRSPQNNHENTQKSSVHEHITRGHSSLTTDDSGRGPTIKETASSQRRINSQVSLPDISDVLGLKPVAETDEDEEALFEEPTTPATTRQYPRFQPCTAVSPRSEVEEQMLLDEEPTNMIPELETVPTDEAFDLDSPVRNDTQFERNLYQRLSSPVPLPQTRVEGKKAATTPTRKSAAPHIERNALRRSSRSPWRKSALPEPKLVPTSPAHVTTAREASSSQHKASHSATTQRRPRGNVTISFLPLNDTAEYHHQSSSSPLLPSAPSLITELEANPASIPHPSQVSTQAPSQGYFPSSSAPQTFTAARDFERERITIKDSSSVPPHLSQITRHVDDSESDVDLDLDPSTLRPGTSSKERKTAQASKLDTDVDITQTPTQRVSKRKASKRVHYSTQSSPVIIAATTRSQRDAKLEVVALTSSSSPPRSLQYKDTSITPQARRTRLSEPISSTKQGKSGIDPHSAPGDQQSPPSSSISSSLYSPSPPRDLKRKYSPIPGFDNDTQSDFTQGGHVTAAYVHRMWDRGDLPTTFVPKPYKVKNFRPSMRNSGGSKKAKQ